MKEARKDWLRKPLAMLVAAAAGAVGSPCEARSDDNPQSAVMNWQAHKLGPKSEVTVLWVGHSLLEQKAQSSWGQVDIMSVVGTFAESRKLSYEMTDHTLWGLPLSALWEGRLRGHERDISEMAAKRERFQRDAARYDTLVLTETIPLAHTLTYAFSAYDLRRFACALWQANPNGRVYLYQTWIHFQGSHLSDSGNASDGFDWRAEMKAERAQWDGLADAARKPAVPAPHWLNRLGWRSLSDAGCAIEAPIFTVPVGDALLALDERLSAPKPGDHFAWPDGTPFQLIDMVSNPIVAPAHRGAGGSDDKAASAAPALRDPSKPMDDIHASLPGIYFSALVHFATLYRQTPVGLPHPAEIGEPLARTLQCIAWETVVSDDRSGVLADPGC